MYRGGDLAQMKHIEEAFDEIYDKYAKMVYGYALQLCQNPVTAEDILQTVFLKAIEHADCFKGKCQVSSWLCQIAKNTWLDMCKSSETKNLSMEQLEQQQGEVAVGGKDNQNPDVLQRIIQTEEQALLFQKLHLLPEPYKEIFMLRVLGCLSFREIGDIFGKTDTWGRVMYYRAREKLKKQIGE